jgi:ABC-type lipoprotein release transport system permease subunit
VLFSVRAGDPVVLGAVALGLTGISLLAAWRPAQAATRVDPLVALRSE